jgi:hypothetical protein
MPRQAKPPRLYLREKRRGKDGKITHPAVWIIIDGGRQFGTGCDARNIDGANQALAAYIAKKYSMAARSKPRDISQVPVADVLSLYVKDVLPKHGDLNASVKRIKRLAAFFGNKTLDGINGPICRAYAEQSSTDTVARADLVLLEAAINHHLREGLHHGIINIIKPPRRPPRERWLTRNEAAQMIWKAYRAKEVKFGKITNRRPRLHLARFIIVGIYTGSRADVIATASFERQPGDPTSTWTPACSIAGRRASLRRRNGDRLSRYRNAFWRTYGAGIALARAIPSN